MGSALIFRRVLRLGLLCFVLMQGGAYALDKGSPAAEDAALLGSGGAVSKAHYAELLRPSVVARLKDVASIQDVRDNQLVGYGLVVGLKGTGDSLRNSPFTEQSMRTLLNNMGVNPPAGATRANNLAAVLVTATMPPFSTPGAKIDVVVSSLGDASSLQGGTLVMTELLGGDGQVYAVAQGSLVVSGFNAQGASQSVSEGVSTSARIPNGAIIERQVEGNFNLENQLVLELRQPDFSTAIEIVDLINLFGQKRYRHNIARERDAKTIILTKPNNVSTTRFIAEIEKLPVPTDEIARVVVDERTGTVVIGEKVRVSRVAISHGSLTVRISDKPAVSQPNAFSNGQTAVVADTDIDVESPVSNLGTLEGTDLDSLVKGLNQIGVKPSGIISILQAIKTAGALHAELIVQ